MKNKLILFTADYPFGTGETFLETEIGYLAAGFDEVKIVSTNIKDEQTRKLPLNCTVERLDLTVSALKKVNSFEGAFSPLFRKELTIIRNIYKMKLTTGIIKTMLISMFKAKKVKKYTEEIVRTSNSSSRLYFYSYWCDDVALSLSLAQKENAEIKTFCRIHRWDVYFEESAVNYLPFRHLITENISQIFSISQDGIDYAFATWKVAQKEKFSLSRLGVNNDFPFSITHNDPFLIASCSNLIPVKRVHLITEALHLIKDISIKWVHIGDGKERNDLENKIALLPKNIQVELKGRIPNPEIYSYYAENRPDLFINVSSSEGVPVSIMEAMSFGIPVIATNVGGNAEIVSQENGRLIPSQFSASDLATIIRQILLLKIENKNNLKENAYSTWKLNYSAKKNYTEFTEKIHLL